MYSSSSNAQGRRHGAIGMCALVLLAVVGGGLAGCQRDRPPPPGLERTIEGLNCLRNGIGIATTSAEKEPPATERALVEWIIANVEPESVKELEDNGTLDAHGKRLVDGWGRPLILIGDPYLKKIGSAGLDGAWDEGRGDDFVVEID